MEKRRLYRSSTDKKISGVCGGIAEYFNIDPTLVRLGWVLISIITSGVPGVIACVIVYFIAAIIMPQY